ncbi:MAG: DUF402 domain-containing protein [Candidatus Latescibacteria bacterium]|jgi:predicted RNA-binding protein associated with RNAse of E/G family|nr:DUF402 domain-containing protein [Candidatus Latescibacterota bacterium]
MRILEVKRHVNKPVERYCCDLVARGEDFALLQYVSDRPWQVDGIRLEAGSITLGHYRDGGGWVLWRMHGSDGRLAGHLFHVCRDQRVEADRVEYLDLMLDLWYRPDGDVVVLDRDEVQACHAEGALSDENLDRIARQEARIRREGVDAIRELEDLLERSGHCLPGPAPDRGQEGAG